MKHEVNTKVQSFLYCLLSITWFLLETRKQNRALAFFGICMGLYSIPLSNALTRSVLRSLDLKQEQNNIEYLFSSASSTLTCQFCPWYITLKTPVPCAQDAQHLPAQLHRLFFPALPETSTLSAPATSHLSLGLARTRR